MSSYWSTYIFSLTHTHTSIYRNNIKIVLQSLQFVVWSFCNFKRERERDFFHEINKLCKDWQSHSGECVCVPYFCVSFYVPFSHTSTTQNYINPFIAHTIILSQYHHMVLFLSLDVVCSDDNLLSMQIFSSFVASDLSLSLSLVCLYKKNEDGWNILENYQMIYSV